MGSLVITVAASDAEVDEFLARNHRVSYFKKDEFEVVKR